MEFTKEKVKGDCCERLYLNDSALLTSPAVLVGLKPLEDNSKYGTYRINLNETIFHPQGGGQPTDTGSIIFPNDIIFEVAFVQSNPNGDIDHFGDFVQDNNVSIEDFSVGTSVELNVNREKRIEHMRLHSAGHVMDAALKRLGFWDRIQSGKGYHFPDNPYVEYIGQLTPEEMELLPSTLNSEIERIVLEDIPTNIYMENKESAGEICGIDTTNYPDRVRVVEVAGCPCPCGGTHIKSTKYLGDIQITKCKKKKKNIRISYVLKN